MFCWCRVSEDSDKLLMRLKLSVAGVCHGSSASDNAASDATFQPLPPDPSSHNLQSIRLLIHPPRITLLISSPTSLTISTSTLTFHEHSG